MDPTSVFNIFIEVFCSYFNVQSLGLSGQTAPRNTLQLQERLLRLGPYNETAQEGGIWIFGIFFFVCCSKYAFQVKVLNCKLHWRMTDSLSLQCGLISQQQYAQWRERGLAFEMREGIYQITNPSLLSSRVFNQVSACLFFYTMILHKDVMRELNFVSFRTEREQSGFQGLLGRHCLQSLPLFWHWKWWQESAEDTEWATHQGKTVVMTHIAC